jgi:uncharacterized protein
MNIMVNDKNKMTEILWPFQVSPWYWVQRVWRVSIISLAFTLLVGCAWFDHKQRELIYRPTQDRPATFKGLQTQDVVFDLEVNNPTDPNTSDRVRMWWLPHADVKAPTLLYLHGTFRNLYHNHRKMEALRAAGFAVLAVEYRGWGDSSRITPSEATIYADANVAWRELVKRQPHPGKRVIFGHSMGTGVAVELASNKHVGADYGGLILEASFTRLPDVAKAVGMLGTMASWFATQEFNSLAKISKVDVPILMLHGSADRTVPVALGQRLFEAAPRGAHWVEFVQGSHSGLDLEAPERYQQAVQSLIQQLP